jgi:hypothetical protein
MCLADCRKEWGAHLRLGICSLRERHLGGWAVSKSKVIQGQLSPHQSRILPSSLSSNALSSFTSCWHWAELAACRLLDKEQMWSQPGACLETWAALLSTTPSAPLPSPPSWKITGPGPTNPLNMHLQPLAGSPLATGKGIPCPEQGPSPLVRFLGLVH